MKNSTLRIGHRLLRITTDVVSSSYASSLLRLLSKQIHTQSRLDKFITNTELIHKTIFYGRSAYYKRPNDARVPSNKEFGVTLLQKSQQNGTEAAENDLNVTMDRNQTISKAMKIYLERARDHKIFLSELNEEFVVGRRHLANMMGVSSLDDFTQEDINNAIRYLMPAGLFDPRARPIMKPPSEIYPSIKEAQFGHDGRPFHTFFYTGRANFYQTCHELENQINHLKEYEHMQQQRGIFDPPKNSSLNLKDTEWLSINELGKLFVEKINEEKFEALLAALQRLADHPYSKLSKDFLMRFRKPIPKAIESMQIPSLKFDENDRPYIEAQGRRKHCLAFVTVRGNGTGLVSINGKDIRYFDFIKDREQIMTPIKFCGLLNKVDIECRTSHLEFSREYSEDHPRFKSEEGRELGTSAESGAIRFAISIALRSFVDQETIEKMRLGNRTSHARYSY
ncbi:hypothetical protein SSS_09210 [Sarcoptes scabiei]|nr:hypothetical protein SSS_09210 [Sarcoptes scabiei]